MSIRIDRSHGKRTSKRKSSSIRKSSTQSRSKVTTHASHATVPTPVQIRKLCKGEGLLVKDSHVIKVLQDIYRTFLIKIVKASGNRPSKKTSVSPAAKKTRAITDEDLMFALTTLFGTKVQSKLNDGTVLVDAPRFRKMFKETLELLASTERSASADILNIIQKAVEVCVARAFLAPVYSWELVDKGSVGKKYVTMESLKKVNQVYLVAGSEYYSPSIVKSTT